MSVMEKGAPAYEAHMRTDASPLLARQENVIDQ
jgi:hypothetical protein